MLPAEVPTHLRTRAGQLERYAPAAAEAFVEAAEVLEKALLEAGQQPLTPQQIEEMGRCSAETVRRKVRSKEVQNVGTPGKILVPAREVEKLPKGRRSRSERASYGARSRTIASVPTRRSE